jgi:predicted MFS family arabinose efflux permease
MNNLYGLNDFEIGLAYVPFGLGTVLGTLLGGKVCPSSPHPIFGLRIPSIPA